MRNPWIQAARLDVSAMLTGVMRRRWLPLAAALALQTTSMAFPGPASVDQSGGQRRNPPVRVAVEAIAIDVQVVDRDGRPVAGLAPDAFNVTINGRRRRVVSAEFIQTRTSSTAPAASSGAAVAPVPQPPAVPAAGRVIMLAVDCLSFSPGVARRAVDAAREFVERLSPEDLVGLFAYPAGPDIDPTIDRGIIMRALDSVVGQREIGPVGQFRLRPSEVIDIASEMPQEDGPILLAVVKRECGDVEDVFCRKRIGADVTSTALYYEAQAHVSLGGLRSLLTKMSGVPGRKTLILVSGGLIASDRPGGRPDISDIGAIAGREAARANTAIYTLNIDTTSEDANSAETRGLPQDLTNLRRDGEVRSRWLENFSGAAGGAFFRVVAGGGDYAYNRILNETSSYYLLGVEPLEADRTGLTQEIKVKVDRRNVTVRSRRWVALPDETATGRRSGSVPDVAAPSKPSASPAAVPPPVVRPLPSALQPLVDAFARGDYAAMHSQLEATIDLANMIRGFRMADPPWPESPRRSSVFALELGIAGLRSDNGFARDQGARLLAEYNARVRQPLGADAFECAWLWAEVAALGGLLRPDTTMAFVNRAPQRCPNEPRLHLAAAIVAEQLWLSASQRSAAATEDVIRRYEEAMKSSETALEARMRAGWMLHRLGKSAQALDLLEVDRDGAPDRYVRYLADLIRGQALHALGRADEAATALRAALAQWPGAQSARIALMTLMLNRGDRLEAAALAEAIESSTEDEFDPWWIYWSGDFRAYPSIIGRLRELSR